MQKYRRIVLIAIDTINVDHFGCYGYSVPKTPTTPFMDSLAQEGVLFERHYATDVPTPPSYTSLFCGIRGIRNGIIGFNNKEEEFRCSTPLLAECFANKGFQTGMISNLLYVCPWLAKGFQHIYPPGLRFQGGTAEEVTDEGTRWLKDHGEKDFFLFLHYWDPHVPYFQRSKEEYRKMFSAGEYKDVIPDMKYFRENKLLKIGYDKKHERNGDSLDPAENLALYDANIRYVDDNIGRLFDNLKELNIKDETLIIITSDHGEAFGEYGFWDHWSSYRNISQLPLIFAGPGLKSAKVSAYTQNVDIMPTLLEVTGLEVPEGLCGRTMVPLIEGKEKTFRKEVVVNSDVTVIQRMYLRDEYALVHTPARPLWDHIKEYELFNLTEDSNQVNDISLEEKGRTLEMIIAYSDWLIEELKGAPDPLWTSMLRGGCGWEWFCPLLTPAELEELIAKYPEIERILKNGKNSVF